MSRNKILLAIGVMVALMPFLGFPSSWKNACYVLSGVVLIVMAFVQHRKRYMMSANERQEVVTEVFVESNGKS